MKNNKQGKGLRINWYEVIFVFLIIMFLGWYQ